MYTIDEQIDYYASRSLDDLEEALEALSATRRSVSYEGEVDDGVEQILRGAIKLRRIQDRLSELVPSRI